MDKIPRDRQLPASEQTYTYSSPHKRPRFLKAFLWFALAIGLLGMNYLPKNFIEGFPPEDTNVMPVSRERKIPRVEQFDRKIAQKFTTVNHLYLYLIIHSKDTSDKWTLLNEAAALMRKRFIHAYSVYNMQENWIAVLAGRLIWRNLSAKVIPDDILKDNVAACSQVSIVFMSLCHQFGIPTRKVGLKGHYTLEAKVNNDWYFFDMDLKPDFNAINGRKSLNSILKYGDQYRLYENTALDSANIRQVFSSVEYGAIDAHPAPRAFAFHYITKFLSHWAWLLPFYFSILAFSRQVKMQERNVLRLNAFAILSFP